VKTQTAFPAAQRVLSPQPMEKIDGLGAGGITQIVGLTGRAANDYAARTFDLHIGHVLYHH
jgi:hypothetical protein